MGEENDIWLEATRSFDFFCKLSHAADHKFCLYCQINVTIKPFYK